MVLEMSTGYSGAFARQVTLSKDNVADKVTLDLLAVLESAATDGAIVLEGNGVADASAPVHLQFSPNARYESKAGDLSLSHEALLKEVAAGKLIVTLTGQHGENCDVEHPQPSIWTLSPIEEQRGSQKFPVLYHEQTEILVSGRHVDGQARIFVDGHRVAGQVVLKDNEHIAIKLEQRPDNGMHLMQLQNPNGQFSNDFILTAADAKPKESDDGDKSKPKTLSEALKRFYWERLVGTWVDEITKGDGLKMKIRWKIKDRVIESESVDAGRTSVSLISVNAQNGDVFQVGADSTGSSHLGAWKFNNDGNAVLNLGYTDGNGTQGELTIRYKLVDDNTLDMTLQFPQPIQIRLVRASK